MLSDCLVVRIDAVWSLSKLPHPRYHDLFSLQKADNSKSSSADLDRSNNLQVVNAPQRTVHLLKSYMHPLQMDGCKYHTLLHCSCIVKERDSIAHEWIHESCNSRHRFQMQRLHYLQGAVSSMTPVWFPKEKCVFVFWGRFWGCEGQQLIRACCIVAVQCGLLKGPSETQMIAVGGRRPSCQSQVPTHELQRWLIGVCYFLQMSLFLFLSCVLRREVKWHNIIFTFPLQSVLQNTGTLIALSAYQCTLEWVLCLVGYE